MGNTTFKLELKTLKNNKEYNINRIMYGENAYDAWHAHEYFNSILEFENLEKNIKKNIRFFNLIKNKYFILIKLLKIFNIKSFLELGSSLFETIDGLESCNKKILKTNKNLKKISYYGIEKSTYFKSIGKIIYPKHKITYIDINDKKKIDLLYDRAVSSYAFSKESELSKFINKAKISYMNISFYRNIQSNNNENFKLVGNNGYRYSLFNIDKIKLDEHISGYYLFGKKRPDHDKIKFNVKKKILRLDGFFLFCSKKNFIKFIDEIKKNKQNKFMPNIDLNLIKNIKHLNKDNFYKFET